MIKPGALAFLLLGSVAAEAETTARAVRFGAIELVEEVRTRDPGEPRIMHVATEWTKYHLRWRAADGAVQFVLTDDGEEIRSFFNTSYGCSGASSFQKFSGRTGEQALFREIRGQFIDIIRSCPRMDSLKRKRYSDELALAADDFVPAVEALKRRAAIKFGSWQNRCIGHKPGYFYHPMPCIMAKQKKN